MRAESAIILCYGHQLPTYYTVSNNCISVMLYALLLDYPRNFRQATRGNFIETVLFCKLFLEDPSRVSRESQCDPAFDDCSAVRNCGNSSRARLETLPNEIRERNLVRLSAACYELRMCAEQFSTYGRSFAREWRVT